METLNSMLYLLSYNSEVTTHALGVLSSYSVLTPLTVGCDVLYRLNIVIDIIEDSVGMGTRHIEGVYLALCS